EGIKKDKAKAIELYEKACQDDEPLGCSNLADIYSDAKDTKYDVELAKKYYQKACDLEDDYSCRKYYKLNL
ncbi:MAG: sel1 repeat family protein, partial [Sulfurovaceae bacterium]